MTQTPEDIRRDIEQTRRELAYDVDTLQEKVRPSAVAGRRMRSVKGAVGRMRDRVMGTASSATETTGEQLSTAKEKVSSAASTVAETTAEVPQQLRRQTEGNPLAAGLIAFGAGWLVSSLLPASETEQQAATQARDMARERSDTLTAPVKEAAQGVKEAVAPAAQQAAESVKSTATEAASTVREEASSAKDEVAGEARRSTEEPRSPGMPY